MSIKLLVVAPLIMGAGVPGIHLGQSPDRADAVPSSVVLDSDMPSVSVKVTNRTGSPARLTGWLNGNQAQAEVPPRSAIVTLTWPATSEGWSRVTLSLTDPGAGASVVSDVEEHPVLVRAVDYGGGPGAAARIGEPVARSAANSVQAQTDADSDNGALPRTGGHVRPYVVLGGGMLGFGLFILGLAWILGRRSPTE